MTAQNLATALRTCAVTKAPRGMFWVVGEPLQGSRWGSRCSALVAVPGRPPALRDFETVEDARQVAASWTTREEAEQALARALAAVGGRS